MTHLGLGDLEVVIDRAVNWVVVINVAARTESRVCIVVDHGLRLISTIQEVPRTSHIP